MALLPLLTAALTAAAVGGPLPAPVRPVTVEVAGADAGTVLTPSAPGAWGGPRTGREPTLSDRVADYDLRAVLDPVKHTIDGTARLTWRNRSAVPIGSLYLHLYLNAFQSEGSTFLTEKRRYGAFRTSVRTREGEWGYSELRSVTQAGRAAAWSFVHPDGGPETDRTVVRIDLPVPVPPGASTTLDIAFFDQLPRVVARTGWFGTFHLAGQWYPKVGVLELPGERGATRPRWNCHEFHFHSEFYADFGAYDLTVIVPPGYTVGASGARLGEPSPGPGGVSHHFRAEDVHDVAFTAWDGFAPPLTAEWTGPGSPRVKVQVLYPPEFEASARETLQATLDSLRYFSETLGPYPYRTSTVVVPPFNAMEAGGMEYETFFTSVGANRPPYDAINLARYVTVHEFGHGYFMGLLASNEFEEPFLDEGLNEWWDIRMLQQESLQPRLPAALRWLGFDVGGLPFPELTRQQAADRHPADPIAGNSWHRWSSESYDVVYARTGAAFHDLTTLLGEETTARAMRLYYARWHHRHPSTADFQQAWLDAGADRATVDRWFAEQVYAATPIDDRIEAVTSEEVLPPLGLGDSGSPRPEVTAPGRQELVRAARSTWRAGHGEPAEHGPGPFPYRSVVTARRLGAQVDRTVLVTFEDGAVQRLDWPAGERWGRWELVGPVPVKQAQLDPAREFMLDLDQLDDGRTRDGHPWPALRVAAAVEGWLRLLLSLVEAL